MAKPGRPFGSTTKLKFGNYVSIEDKEIIVDKCVELAKKGDVVMLKFVAEQIYGKAETSITGADGKALIIQLDPSFKNVITPKTTGSESEPIKIQDNPGGSSIG
jgi:hypothetical protein